MDLEERYCVAVSLLFDWVLLGSTSVALWLSRCTSPGTWTRVEMLKARVYLCMTKGCAVDGYPSGCHEDWRRWLSGVLWLTTWVQRADSGV